MIYLIITVVLFYIMKKKYTKTKNIVKNVKNKSILQLILILKAMDNISFTRKYNGWTNGYR